MIGNTLCYQIAECLSIPAAVVEFIPPNRLSDIALVPKRRTATRNKFKRLLGFPSDNPRQFCLTFSAKPVFTGLKNCTAEYTPRRKEKIKNTGQTFQSKHHPLLCFQTGNRTLVTCSELLQQVVHEVLNSVSAVDRSPSLQKQPLRHQRESEAHVHV